MGNLELFKNLFKDRNRKRENLVLVLILLVVILACMNYIFKDETHSEKSDNNITNSLENAMSYKDENTKENVLVNSEKNLEERISNIISQISGISDVSIVINYLDNGNSNVVFNTKENKSENGIVTSLEKQVAYDEKSGSPLVSKFEKPTVEGVIIVASGINNADLKQRISNAVGTLLGIESYKVQVFER